MTPVDTSALATVGVPTTIISYVGYQPAAIIVPVLTWAREVERPLRIGLFAVPSKDGQPGPAERTKRFLQQQLPATACDIEPLSGEPDPQNRVVRQWVDTHARGHRLVLLVEPGFKFLNIALGRLLRGDVTLLGTDGLDTIVADYTARRFERRRSVDLGLDALLYDLHGLERDRIAAFEATADLPAGLQVLLQDDSVLKLFKPCERAGRLYAAVAVPPDAAGKTLLRGLDRLIKSPHLLNGLRPVLTVVSNDDGTSRRAATAGFTVIAKPCLKGWTPVTSEISPAFGGAPDPVPVPEPIDQACGNTLLTWLGIDAMTTLIAICSHRPDTAIVLVDDTPRVVELAHALKQQAGQLPVGRLVIVPCGHAGQLPTWVHDLKPAAGGRLDFNCSAGMALQGLSVAATTSAALWSIRLAEVKPLLDEQAASLTAVSPSIRLLASVNGGQLSQPDPTAPTYSWTLNQRQTLAALGRAIYQRLHSNGTFECTDLVKLGSLIDGDRQIDVTPLADGRLSVQRQGLGTPVEVSDGGRWLEAVTGACVAAIDPDELVLNLAWRFGRPDRYGVDGERDELDVVARVGHRYFIFDCKAGDARRIGHTVSHSAFRVVGDIVPRQPDLDRKRGEMSHVMEAEGLASRLFRWAIPIAVRPRVSTIELSRVGAAVVDLSTLLEPELLKAALAEIGKRSTTE